MKKIIWIALALVGTAFAYLISQGLHRSVEVQTGEQGGMLLVGLDHTGPYYTIGDVAKEKPEPISAYVCNALSLLFAISDKFLVLGIIK